MRGMMFGDKSSAKQESVRLSGCEDLNFGAAAGKVGLKNLGNTCFMNAGLQCLSHTEPFAAYFLSGRYVEDVNAENNMGSNGELAHAFAKLQSAMWQSDEKTVDPSEFHTRLARYAPHLTEGYEQQDVQEFFAFCVDGLHEDLNRVTTRPPPTTEDEGKEDERIGNERGEEFAAALAWLRYLERGKSFLVDLLQGQLRSTLVCSVCSYRSRRFDPFLYLSLPVMARMSKVTDALEKYLEEEMLSGNEQWFCEKCDARVSATKKIDLWKLPPVLVLHLKRFEFNQSTCTFKKVDPALGGAAELDLSRYCSSAQREGAVYDLICVANHSGPFGYGHYTATCRVGDLRTGSWHHFNDGNVKKVSQNSVLGKDAYVMFFVRRRAVEDAMICQQSVTMPELWPHWVCRRNTGDIDSIKELCRSPIALREAAPPAAAAASAGSADLAPTASEPAPAEALAEAARTTAAAAEQAASREEAAAGAGAPPLPFCRSGSRHSSASFTLVSSSSLLPLESQAGAGASGGLGACAEEQEQAPEKRRSAAPPPPPRVRSPTRSRGCLPFGGWRRRKAPDLNNE